MNFKTIMILHKNNYFSQNSLNQNYFKILIKINKIKRKKTKICLNNLRITKNTKNYF